MKTMSESAIELLRDEYLNDASDFLRTSMHMAYMMPVANTIDRMTGISGQYLAVLLHQSNALS